MPLFRLAHILWVLISFLLWWGLARLHLLRRPQRSADRFRHSLERLGGAFVKLGQMLGIRRDLLPEQFIEALQALQDRVQPFPSDQARAEIERQFKKSIEEVFTDFDDSSLAAASLAQVHKARLRDGREVVVKVRRPGIKVGINRDMRLVYWAVRVLIVFWPGMARYRPLELLRELEYNLRRELDFRVEAHNIQRFSGAVQNIGTIYVPGVVDDLYTEAVLVTELSGGCRVDDPGVIDGRRLAQNFVDAYLYQFFVMGFFHGDPHPGNLFIRPDGRICFHDFGLVGSLDRATRRNLGAFVQAMINTDSEWLVDTYLDLGVVTGDVHRAELRRGIEAMLKEYAVLPLRDWSFAEAFLEIVRIGRVQNIRLPHNLLVFMRTSFLMENTVRSLDPDYNLVDGLMRKADDIKRAIGDDYQNDQATARLKYELGALGQDLPAELSRLVRAVRERGVELPLRLRGLDEFGKHIERSGNRVVVALLAGGLFVAASLLMQHSIGPRWWNFPALSMVGYAWALWLAMKLLRAIGRGGDL